MEINQNVHRAGKWFRFQLREPQPEALKGTNTSNTFTWIHPWAEYTRCLHSTCMYNIPDVLLNGLKPGPQKGKGDVHGVYCYPMHGAALAVSSSGYCVYTSPFEDGWFWGARCELQVAKGMAYKRKMSVGEKQLAAWPGSYSMTALWVHVIHEKELREAYSAEVHLAYNVDKWNPELVKL